MKPGLIGSGKFAIEEQVTMPCHLTLAQAVVAARCSWKY